MDWESVVYTVQVTIVIQSQALMQVVETSFSF